MSKWLYQQLNWSVAHILTKMSFFSQISKCSTLLSGRSIWTLLNLHWHGFS